MINSNTSIYKFYPLVSAFIKGQDDDDIPPPPKRPTITNPSTSSASLTKVESAPVKKEEGREEGDESDIPPPRTERRTPPIPGGSGVPTLSSTEKAKTIKEKASEIANSFNLFIKSFEPSKPKSMNISEFNTEYDDYTKKQEAYTKSTKALMPILKEYNDFIKEEHIDPHSLYYLSTKIKFMLPDLKTEHGFTDEQANQLNKIAEDMRGFATQCPRNMKDTGHFLITHKNGRFWYANSHYTIRVMGDQIGVTKDEFCSSGTIFGKSCEEQKHFNDFINLAKTLDDLVSVLRQTKDRSKDEDKSDEDFSIYYIPPYKPTPYIVRLGEHTNHMMH